MSREELTRSLESRILVLDGAMATELYRHGFVPNIGCCDKLCLSDPQLITEIHLDYLKAGADIITTNTFNANCISLSRYGLDSSVCEINRAGVAIARYAADRFASETGQKCMVAGSVGPAFDNQNHAHDELCDAYQMQITALIQGGVDIVLIETVLGTKHAIAAATAAENAIKMLDSDTAVMVSATLGKEGKLLSGESLVEFVSTIGRFDISAIGLNCGFGINNLSGYMAELASFTTLPTIFYPGTDNSDIAAMGAMENLLKQRRLNIVGGCCGTSTEYIRRLSCMTKLYSPRKINCKPKAENKICL